MKQVKQVCMIKNKQGHNVEFVKKASLKRTSIAVLELKSIYLILFLISRLYILIDYFHENADGKVLTKSVNTCKTV